MTEVRAGMVWVLVFRRPAPGACEFLQLLRTPDPAGVPPGAGGTWQPVAGGIEPGETAARAARRELAEEVGLRAPDPAWLGFWSLDGVHPFFMARLDTIVMAPNFAAEVAAAWEPRLNHENTARRWVPHADVPRLFMWPGQWRACDEVVNSLLPKDSLSRDRLSIQWE